MNLLFALNGILPQIDFILRVVGLARWLLGSIFFVEILRRSGVASDHQLQPQKVCEVHIPVVTSVAFSIGRLCG